MLVLDLSATPESCALEALFVPGREDVSAALPAGAERFAPEKTGEFFVGFDGGRPRAIFLAGPEAPAGHDVFRIARALAGLLSAQRKAGGARLDLSGIADLWGSRALEDLLVNAAYFARTYDRFREGRRAESFPVALQGARVDANRIAALTASLEAVRDLVQQPSSELNPPRYAELAAEMAAEVGAECEVFDEQDLARRGFGGLLSVGRGSMGHAPPRLVRVSAMADPSAPTLVLVGKGITFDTGGYSIKDAEAMMLMKKDMAGSAGALGAVLALARRRLNVNAHALLCCAENVVGPGATRPGDVFRAYGGRTVEVLNTDAEGRLVLIDGLAYAAKDLKPDVLLDVATLTGACKVALGTKIAGLFTDDRGLGDELFEAGRASGERVWPMPLPEDYIEPMREGIADLKNVAKGKFGGAITAALFLKEFVPAGLPWAHMDTYGWDDEGPQGGQPSGFGVRLLERWASDRFGPRAG